MYPPAATLELLPRLTYLQCVDDRIMSERLLSSLLLVVIALLGLLSLFNGADLLRYKAISLPTRWSR